MTFTSTIDTVISSINADIATLESLLGETESETLKSVNLDIFPAPLFDDITGIWTLYQNTPDANGVYEGQYTLAAADGCAIVEIVSVDAHTNPASGAPAALIACGTSNYTDQVSVNALHGKSLKKLKIRSGSPFQVKVKLVAEWCYTFDFTSTTGGFSAVVGGDTVSRAVYTNGWRSIFNNANLGITEVRIQRILPSPVTFTSITIEYTSDYVPQQFDTFNFSAGLSGGSGVNAVSVPVALTTDNLRTDIFYSGFAGGQIVIRRITYYGTGRNPFGTQNCTSP